MKSIRLLSRSLMPQYYDWYENLPKPKTKVDIFIDHLTYKYKKYSFDNFNELYTYLAINNKNELYYDGHKLSIIDNKFTFLTNNKF